MSGSPRPQRIATVYVADRVALDAVPSTADVPAGGGGRTAFVVALLVLSVIVSGALVVVSRMYDLGALLASLLQIVALILLLAALFVLVPTLRAHRAARLWNAAYLRLAADPERAPARIAEMRLLWRADGERCTVEGRAVYGPPDDEREVALGDGLSPIAWVLPRNQAPSIASETAVWHTADHSVVLVRVHADGSGA